ncbi:MAG: hypothetical protein ACXAEF_12920 [Candidatus Thorarchaeota archaeon]
MSPAAPGSVNTVGQAFPIVTTDQGDVVVGGEEFGQGRIVLISDINIFDPTRIVQDDNLDFGVNIANWLTSWGAEILLYTDEPLSPSYYRTPVTAALNELGLDFYLVFDDDFLNLSLDMKIWDLVIVDNPWFLVDLAYDAIYDHVLSGGKFLMSSYRVDNSPSDPLWSLLGFKYTQEIPHQVPLHIWDSSHPTFNLPFSYTEANFTPTFDYGDEGDILEVFSNATAIAGYSESYEANESLIVLGNDGRTLYNGYIIDQFQGDLDESGYTDNFELWTNQIAFLMRPTIDSPANLVIELGSNGETLTWTPNSDRPFSYTIERDTVEIANTVWDGGPISVLLDGYGLGDYIFVIVVYDTAGLGASDIVIVSVEDTTVPALVEDRK